MTADVCIAAFTEPRRSGFSREGPDQSIIFVASELLSRLKPLLQGMAHLIE